MIVDSFDEIRRLAEIAAAAGVRQRVLVRVTVGVEAHTHEFIATAHEDQKFGFSLRDGSAARAVETVLAVPALELAGLHSHIGSQIFETTGFEVAAHRLIGFAATIRDIHGLQVDEVNLGGGLGIAYVSGDDPESPKQTLERLNAIVEGECAAVGLRVPLVSVEPGRAIVGPSAITVYEVGTIKDVTLDAGQTRKYVSVDGGMSDNIRTALYDAEYTCVLANRESHAPAVQARVVGKHCESGDVVVRDTWLPADVRPGDLLAVAATGAYCRSMANNYNYLPRPPVVSVKDGGALVMLRRETEDDLLRLDTGGAVIGASSTPCTGCWTAAEAGGGAVKPLKIALLGCGVVGSQVVRLLEEQRDDLAARVGAPLEIVGIAVRRPARHTDVPAQLLTTDADELVASARRRHRDRGDRWHRTGQNPFVVGASERQERGEREQGAARRRRCDAARRRRAGRSRPLLRGRGGRRDSAAASAARVAGRRSHQPGDRASSTAPPTSSSPGWTPRAPASTRPWTRPPRSVMPRPIPSADVDAYDAAAKAAILAGLAFHTRVTMSDVYREGIGEITAADMASARAMGCTVKLLAICERMTDAHGDERVAVRAHPAMIPRTHPLAGVGDAFNAVFVEAEAAGSLMFYGRAPAARPPRARCSVTSSPWPATGSRAAAVRGRARTPNCRCRAWAR